MLINSNEPSPVITFILFLVLYLHTSIVLEMAAWIISITVIFVIVSFIIVHMMVGLLIKASLWLKTVTPGFIFWN